MSGSRRTFLKYLGAGALGTTGALLPGQAEAFHLRRGRRVGECECECEVVVPASGGKLIQFADKATISFPQSGGVDAAHPQTILGGGGFFTWGWLDAGSALSGGMMAPPPLQLIGSDNTTAIAATVQLIPIAPGGTPAGSFSWAFMVTGVPNGSVFRVWLNYTTSGTAAVAKTAGWFTCGGV